MIRLRRLVPSLVMVSLICELAAPSSAARLEVGPERLLKAPSAAAQIAEDGDKIVIDPATYFDCAAWSASHLTISGAGGAVVITDKTCQGKALFIIQGNDATVQGITFARARVVDGNGAGIRFEGRNLAIAGSRFINNQSGILAAGDITDSVITIHDSEFIDNGACQAACAHSLGVGRIGLLRVINSRFLGTKLSHAIVSNAQQTELIDNIIEDGPSGTSSYLVDMPSGGTILLDHNVLEKGPHSSNLRAAIMIGGGGLLPTSTVIAIGNRFTNDTGYAVSFITNWSSGAPVLSKNEFLGDITPISTSGAWIHTAKVLASDIKGTIRAMAVAAIHLIKPGLAWIGVSH